MQEKIKGMISQISYLLYNNGILKNHLKVKSLDNTIEELVTSEKSFVRFGDGEIRLIEGDKLPLQKENKDLAIRLGEILTMEDERLMIGIPDIFGSVEKYRPESRIFWKKHLLFFRKKYEKYCSREIQYYDAFFSRLYYMYNDRELSTKRFARIKEIWKDSDVVIIESKSAHTGVDNDLLSLTKSVRRIICPESDAYAVYDRILEQAFTYEKDTLFLVSAGATAKPMIVDLLNAGYRAIDIGSLDMEYQWYIMGKTEKCHPPKKNCVTIELDKEAGYDEYISQIDMIIKGV